MVERHAFLRALTWLVPYDEVYNHLDDDLSDEEDDSTNTPPPPPATTCTWPPKTYGSAAHPPHHQQQQQQQQQRALASRILLQECSCCFHKGTQVLFFARDKPDDDATQMSFQIALVEVNPAAFRQAVTRHKKRKQEREQRRQQRRQRQQAAGALPTAAEGGTESSSVLIIGASNNSAASSLTIDEDDNGDGGNNQGEQQQQQQEQDEDDDATVVATLFFRIDGRVYLVDHTAMETIVCPKVDPRSTATAATTDNNNNAAQQQQQQQQPTIPPYASFKFPTVTLRFWLSRLSLSPLNATQPLVSAIDSISRGLTPQTWMPPSLHVQQQPGEKGEGGEVAAIETFLRAVETLLQPPPPSSAWSMEDSSFLLQQAGRVFGQALVPVEHRVGKKRARMVQANEEDKVKKLGEVLSRLFPRGERGGGGGASVAPTGNELDALIRSTEELTRELKQVVREGHREKLLVCTVRAPQGEEPETPLPGGGEEEDEQVEGGGRSH